MTDDEVRDLLKRKAKDAGSLRALSLKMKIAYSYLYDVVHYKKPPSDRILNFLGLERSVRRKQT